MITLQVNDIPNKKKESSICLDNVEIVLGKCMDGFSILIWTTHAGSCPISETFVGV